MLMILIQEPQIENQESNSLYGVAQSRTRRKQQQQQQKAF